MAGSLGVAFVALFPIVNPIGGAPVFYSLTSGEVHERRREARDAWAALTTATRRVEELEHGADSERARLDELARLVEDSEGLVAGEEDALREACDGWESAVVLHGQRADIDGVAFFGLGAGVPVTPWDWSFDLTEEEAGQMLAGWRMILPDQLPEQAEAEVFQVVQPVAQVRIGGSQHACAGV